MEQPTRPKPETQAGQSEDSRTSLGPLSGLKVLELGNYVAAPLCARLMADHGADVIKIERPGEGDPVRNWGKKTDGAASSLWWSVHGRNKQSVSLNVKSARGRELILKLVQDVDVVIENNRPGQLERWGLGYDVLKEVNPSVILVRISGYGQSGPYKDRIAFGAIGEAISGFRYLNGYPENQTDLPPPRPGISLADSVAGLYAYIGTMAALYERDRNAEGAGQVVDVALYETMFSFLEGCLPEFGALQEVRRPKGSWLPTTAPSNTYRCNDGSWVVIGGNSDQIFSRLAALMGMPEIVDDPRFYDNQARCTNVVALDELIGSWTKTLQGADLEKLLIENDVPASRLFTIEDCVNDPQYLSRNMIRPINDPVLGREILHPGVVPHFPRDQQASGIRWPGAEVGAHNGQVLGDGLGLSAQDLEDLKKEGVI